MRRVRFASVGRCATNATAVLDQLALDGLYRGGLRKGVNRRGCGRIASIFVAGDLVSPLIRAASFQ